jgi:hypothetical protein
MHTYIHTHTYLHTMFAVDKVSNHQRMKACYFLMHLSIYKKRYVDILGYINPSHSLPYKFRFIFIKKRVWEGRVSEYRIFVSNTTFMSFSQNYTSVTALQCRKLTVLGTQEVGRKLKATWHYESTHEGITFISGPHVVSWDICLSNVSSACLTRRLLLLVTFTTFPSILYHL